MQDRTSPEPNTLSSQVLEYFRNYSGNENLSTYLRGIVPIRNVEQGDLNQTPVAEEQQRPPLIGQDRIDPTINDTNNEVLQNPSPTSSVASNRKLEWDNGADIGYENSSRQSLHKSLSLPILSTLEKIVPGKKPLRQSPEGNVAEASTQVYYHLTGSSSSSNGSRKLSLPSSSSSDFTEERKLDSTTSSSFIFKPETNDSDITYRNDILEFIHKKVGNPLAESTPGISIGNKPCRRLIFGTSDESLKTLQNSSDSKSTSTENMACNEPNKMHVDSELDMSKLRCLAKFSKKRVMHLSVTKPINVECMNYKELQDKDIQTSLNKLGTNAVAVQTEDDFDSKIIEHNILPVYEDRQIIQFMKYGESSDEPGLRSLGTNTYSDVIASNCNSFEYLYPNDLKKNDDPGSNSKTSQTLSSNVTEASSKTTPLGEMISCNISKEKSVDIGKSITLLHRLLKSKRYDKVTKQYYVKKIVEKILKSNSNSDTSSTSPKDIEEKRRESSSSENLVKPSVSQRLQENVPWVPAPPKNSPRNLETRTFTAEILPETENTRKLKDARFTITSSVFNPAKQTNLDLDDSERCSTSNSSSNDKSARSFRNWKDNVTQSEKVFGERLKCDGDKSDVLLKFAKKERENQINWINNEISHLNKLRNLLEDDHKPKVEIDVLTKPHVEDMRNLKKAASVYVITTDKTKSPSVSPKGSKSPLKPFIPRINPNLREAKLLSSEIYKTDEPFGSVRRYVFEVPIDCPCIKKTGKCTHLKKQFSDSISQSGPYSGAKKQLKDCPCQSGPCNELKKQLKDCTCQNEQCMEAKKQLKDCPCQSGPCNDLKKQLKDCTCQSEQCKEAKKQLKDCPCQSGPCAEMKIPLKDCICQSEECKEAKKQLKDCPCQSGPCPEMKIPLKDCICQSEECKEAKKQLKDCPCQSGPCAEMKIPLKDCICQSEECKEAKKQLKDCPCQSGPCAEIKKPLKDCICQSEECKEAKKQLKDCPCQSGPCAEIKKPLKDCICQSEECKEAKKQLKDCPCQSGPCAEIKKPLKDCICQSEECKEAKKQLKDCPCQSGPCNEIKKQLKDCICQNEECMEAKKQLKDCPCQSGPCNELKKQLMDCICQSDQCQDVKKQLKDCPCQSGPCDEIKKQLKDCICQSEQCQEAKKQLKDCPCQSGPCGEIKKQLKDCTCQNEVCMEAKKQLKDCPCQSGPCKELKKQLMDCICQSDQCQEVKKQLKDCPCQSGPCDEIKKQLKDCICQNDECIEAKKQMKDCPCQSGPCNALKKQLKDCICQSEQCMEVKKQLKDCPCQSGPCNEIKKQLKDCACQNEECMEAKKQMKDCPCQTGPCDELKKQLKDCTCQSEQCMEAKKQLKDCPCQSEPCNEIKKLLKDCACQNEECMEAKKQMKDCPCQSGPCDELKKHLKDCTCQSEQCMEAKKQMKDCPCQSEPCNEIKKQLKDCSCQNEECREAKKQLKDCPCQSEPCNELKKQLKDCNCQSEECNDAKKQLKDCTCQSEPCNELRKQLKNCTCQSEQCKEAMKQLKDCPCQTGPCSEIKKKLKDCSCQSEQCNHKKKQSQTHKMKNLDQASIISPDVNSINTQCEIKSKTSNMSTMTNDLKFEHKLMGHDIDSAIDAASFTEYLGVDKASDYDKQLGANKGLSIKPFSTSIGSMTDAKTFDTKKTGYSSLPLKDQGSVTDKNMFSRGSVDARFIAMDSSMQATAVTGDKSIQSSRRTSMEDVEVQSMYMANEGGRSASVGTDYFTEPNKRNLRSESSNTYAPRAMPQNQTKGSSSMPVRSDSRGQNYNTGEISRVPGRSNGRGQNYNTEESSTVPGRSSGRGQNYNAEEISTMPGRSNGRRQNYDAEEISSMPGRSNGRGQNYNAEESSSVPGRSNGRGQNYNAEESSSVPGRSNGRGQSYNAEESFSVPGRSNGRGQNYNAEESSSVPGRSNGRGQNYNAEEISSMYGRSIGRGQNYNSDKMSSMPGRLNDKGQMYNTEEISSMRGRSNGRGQNYNTESSSDKHNKHRNYQREEDTSYDRRADSRFTSEEAFNSGEYRDKKDRRKEHSSSSSTSTSTASSEQTIYIKICPCCRQEEPKYKSVIKGLPQEIEEALCKPCMNSQITMNPYTGRYGVYPGHVCTCYTLLKTDTVNKIKDTVKKLENIDEEAQYCSCSQRRCTCQEFGKSKKGIAYTLTLEDDYRLPDKEIVQRRSLDEIKLKIPSYKRKHRSKKYESKDQKHKHHKKKGKSSSKMTLQEYLCANRPNFIQTAEERRKAMIDLAYLREQRCQKYKQLLAMTKGVPPENNSRDAPVAKGLFSNKEMKQITAKTYKKLPEVQKKLADRRDNEIKKANRLLADMFNKKVQQNTLKGKVSIPTTASVIKFI